MAVGTFFQSARKHSRANLLGKHAGEQGSKGAEENPRPPPCSSAPLLPCSAAPQPRVPKSAVPILTSVAPSSIAASKSCDIPMDSSVSGNPSRTS